VISSPIAGVPSQPRIWDVPLDRSPPRLLVAYTRAPQIVTDYDYFEFSRQLSPDGRQLVVADPLDVAGDALLVIDLVAGTARRIAIGGGATQPAWSPDGQRIAYRGFTVAGPFQKESGIWVVPAAGGAPQQVWTSDLAPGSGATSVYGWAHDGTGIVFSRGSAEANVVDAATGKITRLGAALQGIAWRAKRPSVALVFDEQEHGPPAQRKIVTVFLSEMAAKMRFVAGSTAMSQMPHDVPRGGNVATLPDPPSIM
jgi:dipeptidyl aminopeptidase/acylaminoacyl peptidase